MAGADDGSPGSFWPWGRRSAIAATGLLLVLLVGAVAVLRLTVDWPHQRWEALVLVGAVLVSFLPVGLVVLGSVAASQGSVSFRGMSVTFGAAVREAADTVSRATVAVPRNVAEGTNIGDSGDSEVLKVMRDATSAEVVVVDLEDGHAWWDSRLLLLCAGATTHGRPNAVVFVATVHTTPRIFVGWADPGAILRAILRAERQLAYAYAVARVHVRRAELTFPVRGSAGQLRALSVPRGLAAAGPPDLRGIEPEELFERHGEVNLPREPADALVRALARTVTRLEEDGTVASLNVVRVHELLDPVLHTASVAGSTSDEGLIGAAASLEVDYLAVTDDGVYRGLMRRRQLVGALLRAVLTTMIDAPDAAADGRGRTGGEAPRAPSPGATATRSGNGARPAPAAAEQAARRASSAPHEVAGPR